MKREPARNVAAIVFAALFIALLAVSCTTTKLSIPQDLSSRELIQKAQERSDAYDWKGARQYYNALLERFGDDSSLKVTAMYELAFIEYKQGRMDSARAGMQAVLDLYASPEGASLPGTWKILAEKVLANIPAPKTAPAEETKTGS